MSEYIDYLKEKEKSIVCLAAGIAALVAAAVVPFVNNSIFCKNYIALVHGEGVVSTGFYIFSLGLLFLGLALILLCGSAKRGRMLIDLEAALTEARKKANGYVSVGVLTERTKKYNAQERKVKRYKGWACGLIVVSALCFAVLFFFFEIKAVVNEFSKEDIDRTLSAFRIWADFFGRLFAYFGMSASAFSCLKIMNNRPVKKQLLYIVVACLAVSAVQIVYHFFGIIWLNPSPSDACIAVLECALAALCVLSLVSENIKSTIRSMGNNQGAEY